MTKPPVRFLLVLPMCGKDAEMAQKLASLIVKTTPKNNDKALVVATLDMNHSDIPRMIGEELQEVFLGGVEVIAHKDGSFQGGFAPHNHMFRRTAQHIINFRKDIDAWYFM